MSTVFVSFALPSQIFSSHCRVFLSFLTSKSIHQLSNGFCPIHSCFRLAPQLPLRTLFNFLSPQSLHFKNFLEFIKSCSRKAFYVKLSSSRNFSLDPLRLSCPLFIASLCWCVPRHSPPIYLAPISWISSGYIAFLFEYKKSNSCSTIVRKKFNFYLDSLMQRKHLSGFRFRNIQ